MTEKNTFLMGMIFMLVGNLMGMFLIAGMVWGDLEGSLFSFGVPGEENLRGLHCPVLITPRETGQISIQLRNPGDEEISRYIRARISQRFVTMTRKENKTIYIDPGETATAAWEIYPEDAAYDRIILFQAYVHRSYPYPSMEGNCGVLVLDIPWLTGGQFFLLAVSLTLLLIVGGGVMVRRSWGGLRRQQRTIGGGLFFLSAIILLDLLISFLGYWLPGLLLLVVIILLMMIMFLHAAV